MEQYILNELADKLILTSLYMARNLSELQMETETVILNCVAIVYILEQQ